MVHGRETEINRIEQLLAKARRGSGGSLVLEGAPGVGKTTLLDVAKSESAGFKVIEAVGVEAQADLAFAAIAEVLRPLHDTMDRIPAAHAVALDAAMGRAEMGTAETDPLVIFSGFSALLNEAGSDQPWLVLLDDAHWFDVSSRACLAYALRRLTGSHCAVIAVTRHGPAAAPLDGWQAPRQYVDGLDDESARMLLQETAPDLAESASLEVRKSARGNPLALNGLPSLLTPGQRAGEVPINRLPPLERVLQEVVAKRLRGLSEESMEALLLLALSPARGTGTALGAMNTIGLGDPALKAAEEHDLIEVSGTEIEFTHPLLRGELVRRANPADRRKAHLLLAHHSHPEARAWHLAAAAMGPDDMAANALEAAARSASSRGAHASASDAMTRAAELTESDPVRWTRLFSAGLSAALAGDYPHASELLDYSAEGAMRPYGRHLQAMVRLAGGTMPAIEDHRLLISEAELARHEYPEQAALMFADAAVIAVVAGDFRAGLAAARRADDLIDEDAYDALRCQVDSALGIGLALAGETAAARDALDSAGRRLDQVEPQSAAAVSICFSLGARLCTGQKGLLLDEMRSFILRAERAGVIGLVPYFHIQASDAAYRLGQWDSALADSEKAVDKSQATGQVGPLSAALVVKSRIHAVRGEFEEAEACALRCLELAGPAGYGSTEIWGKAALGFLYLGSGDPERAIVELEPLTALSEKAGMVDPVLVPWAPDLIEALVEVGRIDYAGKIVPQLREAADRNGLPLALGFAARCESLVDPGLSGDSFDAAITFHGQSETPLERGRTLMMAGTRYAQGGQADLARDRIEAATEVFERLGAIPWIERAGAMLAGSRGSSTT